jgi:hypothetical protein
MKFHVNTVFGRMTNQFQIRTCGYNGKAISGTQAAIQVPYATDSSYPVRWKTIRTVIMSMFEDDGVPECPPGSITRVLMTGTDVLASWKYRVRDGNFELEVGSLYDDI